MGGSVKAPLLLETERLVLTVPAVADAEAIFERYASDPEVTRYVGWPRHRSIADTRGFLEFSAAEWERAPGGPYLIRLRSDGQLLGGTGLGFDRPDEPSTGYILAKDAWGHGYATEALRAMVDVCRQLGVPRMYALCHPEHHGSRRVLEKCGFSRDPHWSAPSVFPNLAPDGPLPSLRYGLVLQSGR
jgi:RimJ/RimL family protein N-acetyltransferase